MAYSERQVDKSNSAHKFENGDKVTKNEKVESAIKFIDDKEM